MQLSTQHSSGYPQSRTQYTAVRKRVENYTPSCVLNWGTQLKTLKLSMHVLRHPVPLSLVLDWVCHPKPSNSRMHVLRALLISGYTLPLRHLPKHLPLISKGLQTLFGTQYTAVRNGWYQTSAFVYWIWGPHKMKNVCVFHGNC